MTHTFFERNEEEHLIRSACNYLSIGLFELARSSLLQLHREHALSFLEEVLLSCMSLNWVPSPSSPSIPHELWLCLQLHNELRTNAPDDESATLGTTVRSRLLLEVCLSGYRLRQQGECVDVATPLLHDRVRNDFVDSGLLLRHDDNVPLFSFLASQRAVESGQPEASPRFGYDGRNHRECETDESVVLPFFQKMVVEEPELAAGVTEALLGYNKTFGAVSRCRIILNTQWHSCLREALDRGNVRVGLRILSQYPARLLPAMPNAARRRVCELLAKESVDTGRTRCVEACKNNENIRLLDPAAEPFGLYPQFGSVPPRRGDIGVLNAVAEGGSSTPRGGVPHTCARCGMIRATITRRHVLRLLHGIDASIGASELCIVSDSPTTELPRTPRHAEATPTSNFTPLYTSALAATISRRRHGGGSTPRMPGPGGGQWSSGATSFRGRGAPLWEGQPLILGSSFGCELRDEVAHVSDTEGPEILRLAEVVSEDLYLEAWASAVVSHQANIPSLANAPLSPSLSSSTVPTNATLHSKGKKSALSSGKRIPHVSIDSSLPPTSVCAHSDLVTSFHVVEHLLSSSAERVTDSDGVSYVTSLVHTFPQLQPWLVCMLWSTLRDDLNTLSSVMAAVYSAPGSCAPGTPRSVAALCDQLCYLLGVAKRVTCLESRQREGMEVVPAGKGDGAERIKYRPAGEPSFAEIFAKSYQLVLERPCFEVLLQYLPFLTYNEAFSVLCGSATSMYPLDAIDAVAEGEVATDVTNADTKVHAFEACQLRSTLRQLGVYACLSNVSYCCHHISKGLPFPVDEAMTELSSIITRTRAYSPCLSSCRVIAEESLVPGELTSRNGGEVITSGADDGVDSSDSMYPKTSYVHRAEGPCEDWMGPSLGEEVLSDCRFLCDAMRTNRKSTVPLTPFGARVGDAEGDQITSTCGRKGVERESWGSNEVSDGSRSASVSPAGVGSSSNTLRVECELDDRTGEGESSESSEDASSNDGDTDTSDDQDDRVSVEQSMVAGQDLDPCGGLLEWEEMLSGIVRVLLSATGKFETGHRGCRPPSWAKRVMRSGTKRTSSSFTSSVLFTIRLLSLVEGLLEDTVRCLALSPEDPWARRGGEGPFGAVCLRDPSGRKCFEQLHFVRFALARFDAVFRLYQIQPVSPASPPGPTAVVTGLTLLQWGVQLSAESLAELALRLGAPDVSDKVQSNGYDVSCSSRVGVLVRASHRSVATRQIISLIQSESENKENLALCIENTDSVLVVSTGSLPNNESSEKNQNLSRNASDHNSPDSGSERDSSSNLSMSGNDDESASARVDDGGLISIQNIIGKDVASSGTGSSLPTIVRENYERRVLDNIHLGSASASASESLKAILVDLIVASSIEPALFSCFSKAVDPSGALSILGTGAEESTAGREGLEVVLALCRHYMSWRESRQTYKEAERTMLAFLAGCAGIFGTHVPLGYYGSSPSDASDSPTSTERRREFQQSFVSENIRPGDLQGVVNAARDVDLGPTVSQLSPEIIVPTEERNISGPSSETGEIPVTDAKGNTSTLANEELSSENCSASSTSSLGAESAGKRPSQQPSHESDSVADLNPSDAPELLESCSDNPSPMGLLQLRTLALEAVAELHSLAGAKSDEPTPRIRSIETWSAWRSSQVHDAVPYVAAFTSYLCDSASALSRQSMPAPAPTTTKPSEGHPVSSDGTNVLESIPWPGGEPECEGDEKQVNSGSMSNLKDEDASCTDGQQLPVSSGPCFSVLSSSPMARLESKFSEDQGVGISSAARVVGFDTHAFLFHLSGGAESVAQVFPLQGEGAEVESATTPETKSSESLRADVVAALSEDSGGDNVGRVFSLLLSLATLTSADSQERVALLLRSLPATACVRRWLRSVVLDPAWRIGVPGLAVANQKQESASSPAHAAEDPHVSTRVCKPEAAVPEASSHQHGGAQQADDHGASRGTITAPHGDTNTPSVTALEPRGATKDTAHIEAKDRNTRLSSVSGLSGSPWDDWDLPIDKALAPELHHDDKTPHPSGTWLNDATVKPSIPREEVSDSVANGWAACPAQTEGAVIDGHLPSKLDDVGSHGNQGASRRGSAVSDTYSLPFGDLSMLYEHPSGIDEWMLSVGSSGSVSLEKVQRCIELADETSDEGAPDTLLALASRVAREEGNALKSWTWALRLRDTRLLEPCLMQSWREWCSLATSHSGTVYSTSLGADTIEHRCLEAIRHCLDVVLCPAGESASRVPEIVDRLSRSIDVAEVLLSEKHSCLDSMSPCSVLVAVHDHPHTILDELVGAAGSAEGDAWVSPSRSIGAGRRSSTRIREFVLKSSGVGLGCCMAAACSASLQDLTELTKFALDSSCTQPPDHHLEFGYNDTSNDETRCGTRRAEAEFVGGRHPEGVSECWGMGGSDTGSKNRHEYLGQVEKYVRFLLLACDFNEDTGVGRAQILSLFSAMQEECVLHVCLRIIHPWLQSSQADKADSASNATLSAKNSTPNIGDGRVSPMAAAVAQDDEGASQSDEAMLFLLDVVYLHSANKGVTSSILQGVFGLSWDDLASLRLGLRAILKLPPSLHTALRHLVADPSLVVEALLMAKETALVAFLLEALPDLRSCVADDLFVVYARKALALDTPVSMDAALISEYFDGHSDADDTLKTTSPLLVGTCHAESNMEARKHHVYASAPDCDLLAAILGLCEDFEGAGHVALNLAEEVASASGPNKGRTRGPARIISSKLQMTPANAAAILQQLLFIAKRLFLLAGGVALYEVSRTDIQDARVPSPDAKAARRWRRRSTLTSVTSIHWGISVCSLSAEEGPAFCDAMLAYVKLMALIALSAPAISFTLEDLCVATRIRALRDKLVADDHMELSVDLCGLGKIETDIIYATWGKAALLVGEYEAARSLFGSYLDTESMLSMGGVSPVGSPGGGSQPGSSGDVARRMQMRRSSKSIPVRGSVGPGGTSPLDVVAIVKLLETVPPVHIGAVEEDCRNILAQILGDSDPVSEGQTSSKLVRLFKRKGKQKESSSVLRHSSFYGLDPSLPPSPTRGVPTSQPTVLPTEASVSPVRRAGSYSGSHVPMPVLKSNVGTQPPLTSQSGPLPEARGIYSPPRVRSKATTTSSNEGSSPQRIRARSMSKKPPSSPPGAGGHGSRVHDSSSDDGGKHEEDDDDDVVLVDETDALGALAHEGTVHLASQRFAECLYYLQAYGSARGLVAFLASHGHTAAALDVLVEAGLGPDVFVEDVLKWCIHHRCTKRVLDALRRLPEEKIVEFVPPICQCLEITKSYRLIHDFQVLAKDHVRAGVTVVRRYLQTRANSSTEQQLQQLTAAKDHFMDALLHQSNPASIVSTKPSDVSSVSAADSDMIEKWLKRVRLQMEILKAFGDEGSALCFFDEHTPKRKIAAIVLVNNFELGFRIVNDLRLNPTSVYADVVRRLASERDCVRLDAVLLHMKNTVALRDVDEVLFACVESFAALAAKETLSSQPPPKTPKTPTLRRMKNSFFGTLDAPASPGPPPSPRHPPLPPSPQSQSETQPLSPPPIPASSRSPSPMVLSSPSLSAASPGMTGNSTSPGLSGSIPSGAVFSTPSFAPMSGGTVLASPSLVLPSPALSSPAPSGSAFPISAPSPPPLGSAFPISATASRFTEAGHAGPLQARVTSFSLYGSQPPSSPSAPSALLPASSAGARSSTFLTVPPAAGVLPSPSLFSSPASTGSPLLSPERTSAGGALPSPATYGSVAPGAAATSTLMTTTAIPITTTPATNASIGGNCPEADSGLPVSDSLQTESGGSGGSGIFRRRKGIAGTKTASMLAEEYASRITDECLRVKAYLLAGNFQRAYSTAISSHDDLRNLRVVKDAASEAGRKDVTGLCDKYALKRKQQQQKRWD